MRTRATRGIAHLLLTTASIGKRLNSQASVRMSMADANRKRLQHHLDAVDLGAAPRIEVFHDGRPYSDDGRGGNDDGGSRSSSVLAAEPLPPSFFAGGLAVLDSSFNPPTRAHLRMLSVAAQQHGLSCSLLLLAKQNADKAVIGASLVQRLEMMELLADAAQPAGSTLCGVTAHPLFVDKAAALRALLRGGGSGAASAANQGEPRIVMLVGYDTWIRIVDPKYYGGEDGRTAALSQIFANVEVVVASRDASSASNLEPLSADEQEAAVLGGLPEAITRSRLHFMRNEQQVAELSSSALRGALSSASGEGGGLPEQAREMLPDCLHAYVEAEGLYRPASEFEQ